MTIEAIAAITQAQGAAVTPVHPVQVGYDVGLGDIARFENAYAGGAQGLQGAQMPAPAASAHSSTIGGLLESGPLRAMLGPLQRINTDAVKMSGQGLDSSMKPSDMVKMTMQAQEFLFHCELTSNVANRTSDGIQQLFRQQG